MLHSVNVKARQAGKGEAFIYVLSIPGIREDTPRMFIGDSVFLQGLDTVRKRINGLPVEAEVIGILKAKGEVFVMSPMLPSIVYTVATADPRCMFQVSFRATAAPVCAMQDAVSPSELCLQPKNSLPLDVQVRRLDSALRATDSTARRWLFSFPNDKNVSQRIVSSLDPMSIDSALNEEQSSAILAIASRNHTIPYLISGPPGTGKTKTLVAAILAILTINPHAHILACAPSNPASDTIIGRLIPHLSSSQMFRLNPPNRTFAEVPDDILRYCHIDDNAFGLPTYETLMQFKVVITTCIDAAILFDARAANVDIISTELSISGVFHPQEPLALRLHWTHLLVDEAGQASEPEMAVPLSVVLPPSHPLLISNDPVVVLCGDVHQLGPIIPSFEARQGELDVSLLERLFERDVYAAHPMSRSNMRKASRSAVHLNGPDVAPPSFCNLVRVSQSIEIADVAVP